MSNMMLAPGKVKVQFGLDPVYNNLSTLYMIATADLMPQLNPWIYEAAGQLSAEQMHRHRLLFDVLYSAFEPDEDWADFPTYLADLTAQFPLAMRQRFLRHMFPQINTLTQDEFMDVATFISQISRREFDREVSDESLVEAHQLLSEPEKLQDVIVTHLTDMWREILAITIRHRLSS